MNEINAICYECKYYALRNDIGLCNLTGIYKSKRNTCSYFVRAEASVKTDDLSLRVDTLEEKVKELETILNFLKR